MITVYPVLGQLMVDRRITARELAAVVDLNLFMFYMKMWGVKQWTLAEALKICCFFRTPHIEQVFVRNNNKQQFLESQEEITSSHKMM